MANIEASHRAVFDSFRDTFAVSLGSRYIPAIIASTIGFGISILVSLKTGEFFAKQAEIEFRTLAASRAAVLGKAVDRDLAILQSLGGFYAASRSVERDEFRVSVERHGGRIRAEGRPGDGATVTIELPGKQDQPGAPTT